MLATYFMTLSGTPIIYQGRTLLSSRGPYFSSFRAILTLPFFPTTEEIGMVNIPKDVDVEKEYKDCESRSSAMLTIFDSN